MKVDLLNYCLSLNTFMVDYLESHIEVDVCVWLYVNKTVNLTDGVISSWLDLDALLHDVEEDVGGGTFRVRPRNLLHPRVIAVVPLTCLTVHHLPIVHTAIIVLHLPYVVPSIERPRMMRYPIQLIGSIFFAFMI